MQRLSIVMTILLILFGTGSLRAQHASDILKPDMGAKIGVCPVCGMDVSEKMLTRVDVIHGDTTFHACALGCASALIAKHPYDEILVVDCDSIGMIPAMGAFYLFGSRIIPSRSMLPELSFGRNEAALRFQKLYGGTVYHGKESFDVAAKIRQERMNEKKKDAGKKL